jgi:hypothetical protein
MRFHLDCMMCGRRRRVTFIQWVLGNPVFCPASEVSSCIATYRAMTEEPPEEEPDDPDLLPPEDLLVCERCRGSGEVFVRQDWYSGGLDFDTCTLCQGTGAALIALWDGKVWAVLP